jgi:hypothetical protein
VVATQPPVSSVVNNTVLSLPPAPLSEEED